MLWKVENVVEVQRRWRVQICTPPPTRITVTRIPNKFEFDGTVQDVLKVRCGRKRSSTDNRSADAVMQDFARSPKKSLRQCSCEIGTEKSSVHRILRAQKWKPLHSETCPRSMLSLGVYCGSRWTFRTSTGLKKIKK